VINIRHEPKKDPQKRIRRLDVQKTMVLFPAGGRNLSLLVRIHIVWVTHPLSYLVDSRGCFPADVKADGTWSWTFITYPIFTQVNIGWSYTSTRR